MSSGAEGTSADEVVYALRPGLGAEPSTISWPAGPHYFDLTGSQGAVAWVRYRIWAADWHTRALKSVAGTDGNYDRLLGIEMALDGALNNLSGAFDAAVGLLIRGAEEALHVPEPKQLQVHRYSWRAARDLLAKPAIGTTERGTSKDSVWRVILDVDNALAGESDTTPVGWLAQLRRWRNQVAHQDTLARIHSADRPGRVRAFGDRTDGAFHYLATACDDVHELTSSMVSLAVELGAREVTAGWQRRPWRDEPSTGP